MNEVTNDDVVRVMVDGGERLCDHALSKWIADEYKLGEEMRQAYITWWATLRRRIRPLAKQLKEAKRDEHSD